MRKTSSADGLYRFVFEKMTAACCVGEIVYDPLANPADYRILDINPAYELLMKVKRAEVVGVLGSELYGDSAIALLPCFSRVAESGRSEIFEVYFKPIERHVQIRVSSPARGFFSTLITDITERLAAERVIANEASWRRLLIEQSRDGIVILDNDGYVIEANKKYAEMLGYSREEVRCLHVSDWEAVYDKEVTLAMIRSIGPEGDHFQTKHRRKDGSLFEVEISTNGAVIDGRRMVFCVCRDLTERKNSEERLRQLQKAEGLRRMAGAISHHYNNLLGIVIGNLELARMENEKNVTGRVHDASPLSEALEASYKASELGKVMLTYLGHLNEQFDRMDLREIGWAICKETIPGSNRALDLKVELVATPIPILGNKKQISRIVDILVSNAVEAGGGRCVKVELRFSVVEALTISRRHRFPVDFQSEAKHYALIKVVDDACGIAESDIDKIFDPFYSTKFTGRGLDLPVALGILKGHEGCVAVESKVGEGSVFQVYLPLDEA